MTGGCERARERNSAHTWGHFFARPEELLLPATPNDARLLQPGSRHFGPPRSLAFVGVIFAVETVPSRATDRPVRGLLAARALLPRHVNVAAHRPYAVMRTEQTKILLEQTVVDAQSCCAPRFIETRPPAIWRAPLRAVPNEWLAPGRQAAAPAMEALLKSRSMLCRLTLWRRSTRTWQ